MSLKESLQEAADRVKDRHYKKESYQFAIKACIDQHVEKTASSIYKSICDDIADKIYTNGNNMDNMAKGSIFLPCAVDIHVEETQAYKDCPLDERKSINSMIPDFRDKNYDSVSSSIYLWNSKSSDKKGGFLSKPYRLHSVCLTDYGKRVVSIIQEMAQKDNICISIYAMYQYNHTTFKGYIPKMKTSKHQKVLPLYRKYKCEASRIISSSVTLQYYLNNLS